MDMDSGSAPGAAAASADTTSITQEANGTQSTQGGSKPGEGAEQGKEASAKTVQEQIRELGEQDLDALVTIKVNGETKKVPLKQAIKWAQLGDSAYSKMKEAAEVKNQAQQLFQLAKQNPREFFRVTGMNPREVSERLLLEELQHDALTPDQKELKAHREWRAQQERQAKEQEEHQKQSKAQAEYQKENSAMRSELVRAWQDSGLPEDARFGAWIAATMVREENLGNSLSPKEAAGIVKQDFLNHAKTVFSKVDPQLLEEWLGAETLKKWREHDVKRVTQSAAQKSGSLTSRPPGSGASNPKTKTQKPMNEREWADWYASR